MGCEVFATDISKNAIQFQNKLIELSPFKEVKELDSVLQELDLRNERNFIAPTIKVEDFITTIPEEKFEIILNTRAIQWLSSQDMKKAAKTFFVSNKDGGTFIATTMNVQGIKRTEIENAFVDAGYIIPNVKAEQWYRKVLDETWIVYAMVLGRPIIPEWWQYEDKGWEEQKEKDKKTLMTFEKEYKERLRINYEQDKNDYKPWVDKIAHVIYNTW